MINIIKTIISIQTTSCEEDFKPSDKMRKVYKQTITRAFTLVESLVAISLISGIASVGYVGFVKVQANSKAAKLKQDIAVVNNALRVYEAHGGDINENETPQSVIAKLKTVASEESFKEIIGLRESMIDRRLKIVMQSDSDAIGNNPRALWDHNRKKFRFSSTGRKGIKAFEIGDDANIVPVQETRNSNLKLAKKSNWVWDYEDSKLMTSGENVPVNLVEADDFSGLSSEIYDGPLELNMPSFSMVGGKYSLDFFADANLLISNPNPENSSRIFYTSDGNNWSAYNGESILVDPGETFAAISASMDSSSWLDSEVNLNTYTVDPVKLEVDLIAQDNPVNYRMMGGEMESGGEESKIGSNVFISLKNSDNIPLRFINSDNFNVIWSLSQNDPTFSEEGSVNQFSNGFLGKRVHHDINTWKGKDELGFQVVARSLNSSIFNDSEIEKLSIGIQKLQLEQPSTDFGNNASPSSNEVISLFPNNANGALPKAWRIYYTTNGVDPGFDSFGEPVSGELYASGIDLSAVSGETVDVRARVYGPSGFGNWFSPSPPMSFSLNKWIVPEWQGYVGGVFHRMSVSTYHNIRQHLISGGVDASFNPGSGLNGSGKAIALQSDGKLIVGGEFTMANGVKSNRIVRFEKDGRIDLSFVTGEGFDNDVLALVIQPDGRIVVGGKFQKYNGQYRMGLARLNSDGSLDSTFNVGRGVHTDQNGWVHGLDIQKKGWSDEIDYSTDPYKIIVAGCFTRYNNYPAFSLARVHINGALDVSFNTTVGVQGIVHGVSVQQDRNIMIGGNFEKYDGVDRKNIARVDADSGKLDQSFDPGAGTDAPIYTVSTDSEGQVLIGGGFGLIDGTQANGLAKLFKSGAVDGAFNFNSIGYGDWTVYSSYINENNEIYVGGEFSPDVENDSKPFVKLNSNGELVSGYIPQPLPKGAAVYAIVESSFGNASITGKFPETLEKKTENIALLNTQSGSVDESFDVGKGANGAVNVVSALSDGDLVIAGGFSMIKGQPRNGIAKISTEGEVKSFSSLVEGGEILTVAEQTNGKVIIGGSFTSVGGNYRFKGIARLNVDGSVDESFVPPGEVTKKWVQEHDWKTWVGSWVNVSTSGFDNAVRSVKILSDGKILVCGSFRYYGDIYQPSIALLNEDGSLNERFSIANNNIPSVGSVYDCLRLNDRTIFIVGDFPERILSYKEDGSLNESFSSEYIDSTIHSVSLAKSGKILIGGNFTRIGDRSLRSVAVLDKNGKCDEAFNSTLNPDDEVYKVIGLPDGGAVLMGGFSKYGESNKNGIVKLNAEGSVDESFGSSELEVTKFITSY